MAGVPPTGHYPRGDDSGGRTCFGEMAAFGETGGLARPGLLCHGCRQAGCGARFVKQGGLPPKPKDRGDHGC
jgi:hypothetical protein